MQRFILIRIFIIKEYFIKKRNELESTSNSFFISSKLFATIEETLIIKENFEVESDVIKSKENRFHVSEEISGSDLMFLRGEVLFFVI